MKVFTITHPKVAPGASVQKVSLNNKVLAMAIVVGEKKTDHIIVDKANKKVYNAKLSKTSGGHHKLVGMLAAEDRDRDTCLIVCRTEAGWGYNSHHTGHYVEEIGDYAPFPGSVLATGIVKKGRGQSEQIIAIMPANVLFRIKSGLVEHYYCFDGEDIHVR